MVLIPLPDTAPISINLTTRKQKLSCLNLYLSYREECKNCNPRLFRHHRASERHKLKAQDKALQFGFTLPNVGAATADEGKSMADGAMSQPGLGRTVNFSNGSRQLPAIR